MPFDKQPPFVTSGIRIGNQALTSRGMKEDDMVQVAEFIDQVFANGGDESRSTAIGKEVTEFSRSFHAFEDTISKHLMS